MCNQSSLQDQLSNFIVNNAYPGQTLSLLSFRIKPKRYEKKYKFYYPIT